MSAAYPAVVAAVCAVLSWIGVAGALRYVRRKAVIDIPTDRSSHKVPTPRGGGLGFVTAGAVCFVAEAARRGDPAWALGALPVVAACAIGFADDRRPMSWPLKLVLMFGAAALALPLGRVESVELPYVGRLPLSVLSVPLTLCWICGFGNAFNFMDGVNGISGITAVVSGAGFATAGVVAGDERTAFLGALAAGMGAGFLPWNFPRAKIFMGDGGSLPLGTILAAAAVTAQIPAAPGAAPAIEFPASVLLLGPYMFDVTFTLRRRAREGKKLGQAHSEHLYQRLARGFGSHVPSALAYGGLAAGTSALAVAWRGWGDLGRLLSLILPPLALLASVPWVFARERSRAEPRNP